MFFDVIHDGMKLGGGKEVVFDEKTVVEEAIELLHERCEKWRGGFELRPKIFSGITSSLSIVTYLVGIQGPFRAMRMR